MVYICGKDETLRGLYEQEGFEGDFSSYQKEFFSRNLHLDPTCIKLPELEPIFPVRGIQLNSFDTRMFLEEIKAFSHDEKVKLRSLYENDQYIPELVALQDIMEGAQKHAVDFRKQHNSPLISAPWKFSLDKEFDEFAKWDEEPLGPPAMGINHGQVLSLFGEYSKMGATFYRGSYASLDRLYESLVRRDALSRLLMIAEGKHVSSANLNPDIIKQMLASKKMSLSSIEAEMKVLTHEIKTLLPKGIDTSMKTYLSNRFTSREMHQMRGLSYSLRRARRGGGGSLSIGIEFLNRSGLRRARVVIKGITKAAETVANSTYLLDAGMVAYDVVQANKDKNKDAGKVLFSESLGTAAAWTVGRSFAMSALGEGAIGALVGDAALTGAVIVCSPLIGTAIMIVGGLIVTLGIYKLVVQAVDEGYIELPSEWRQNVNAGISYVIETIESSYKDTTDWFQSFYEKWTSVEDSVVEWSIEKSVETVEFY